MKKSSLLLLSVCLLAFGVNERALGRMLSRPIASPKSLAGAARQAQTTSRARQAHEYFVDCGAEMNGDGSSPARAWRSLNDVNGHTFVPGDVILLKRETKCHGVLWPKGSGSASSAIRLSAYGQGARPKVIAEKDNEEAFKLFDQEYWDVDSIEFSGGTIFGVLVSGQTGTLHHIHLRNLLVHDVYGGEVKHKESGLVVISPGKVEQHFDDVLVEGVTAYDTDQWAGILVGGGNFGDVEEKNWNTHVAVRNSVVHDLYGDGIILFRVKDGLIDSSAAWRTGMQTSQSIGTPNAIWTWMCKDCVVSNNEAFLTDSPGVDGGAFDIDYGNTRNSVVANYGHDTQGYCIAVFAAGYVTHESLVQGNLCINNGESPRLGRYQGALFIWTWNNGIIDGLRVEKNIIYWSPPGNFPALLNRGDIRGVNTTFGWNQIYSSASSIIESKSNLAFHDNLYVKCGDKETSWVLDSHVYSTFDQYRDSTRREQGSNLRSEEFSRSCFGMEPSQAEGRSSAVRASNATATALKPWPGNWTVVSDLPVNLDAEELLDFASRGQLVVLKNLSTQFRNSGLALKVRLHLSEERASELVQNLIRDLAMSNVEVSLTPGREFRNAPTTRIIAPDGSIAKEWRMFVGPAEMGLPLRKVLGKPNYSQMISTRSIE